METVIGDIPIEFNLKLEEFIEQLVNVPNFTSNYHLMWLCETLPTWTKELTDCDLFEPGKASDLLPIFLNYVIYKLRSSTFETITQFIQHLEKDTKTLFNIYKKDGWKCFENFLLLSQSGEEQSVEDSALNSTEGNADGAEGDSEDEFLFDIKSQLFSDQIARLLRCIEKAFSTRFKFHTFSLAFSTPFEKPTREMIMTYALQFPKKYLPEKDKSTLKVATKFSKQLVAADTKRISFHKLADMVLVDDEEEKISLESEKPYTYIMPLSSAENLGDEIWETYQSKTEKN